MAVMAVRVEDLATLKMNEFFDYDGTCYGVSRSRALDQALCAELEDFYQGTVRSEKMEKVPVFFIYEGKIVGWYRQAVIYRYIRRVSLFLEGNIEARTRDALLLPEELFMDAPEIIFNDMGYAVIEDDDLRCGALLKKLNYRGKSVEIRYDFVDIFMDKAPLNKISRTIKDKKKVNKACEEYCLLECQKLAADIMDGRCEDLRPMKLLLAYSELAVTYQRQSVDGYYYQAMACHQLGFIKQGLKAIEKAIAIEPDGDDLLVLKGNLLVSYQQLGEAIRMYEEAYEIHPLEEYRKLIKEVYDVRGLSVRRHLRKH